MRDAVHCWWPSHSPSPAEQAPASLCITSSWIDRYQPGPDRATVKFLPRVNGQWSMVKGQWIDTLFLLLQLFPEGDGNSSTEGNLQEGSLNECVKDVKISFFLNFFLETHNFRTPKSSSWISSLWAVMRQGYGTACRRSQALTPQLLPS